jgi:CHAT domain-containing protein
VIVPDGHLYRLPFPALQSRKTHQYWVEMMPILESTSTTYFLSGNGVQSGKNSHIAYGSRRYDAFINAELNTLREVEPGMPTQAGPQVTKEGFLKALQSNSLFYYAGHSAFDMRNALQSSILLDGDKPGPNAVSALDIMQKRIQRNALVVLSSCETSLGNSTDGAGIGGLTSAFLLGGAGAVVGSVWPVESSSTMQLMSRLFKSVVKDKRSTADSLRTAQLTLMHDASYRHPYYWGGFVVTGNWSAIAR